MSSAFNRSGIYPDGWRDTRNTGLDTYGHTYSQNLLGTIQTFNNTPFWIDPLTTLNVVSAAGQTISLSSGNFSFLRVLGTGVNGNQPSQPFTVAYSDGTTIPISQSLSDWQNPQSYPGESEAFIMPYMNDVSTGGRIPTATYLYEYSLPLDETKTVAGVTLPNNANVEVLSMTLIPTATTTTLTSSANPSIYEQPVTFTASVTSPIGAPPDGATITFMNSQTILGTAAMSGGSASFTTAALAIGTYSITAVYGGGLGLAPSTSNVLNQAVLRIPTITALTSSLNPSVHGQSVTFTATVTSVEGVPPDGDTVTFMNGNAALATERTSGGSARFTTSTLPVGTNPITAVYLGDAILASGTSNVVSQVVNKSTAVKTATTLSSSPDPSAYGQPVIFTAVVTSSIGPPPDGETVTFMSGKIPLGFGMLSGGSATFTTSSLKQGTTSVTAVYGGDTNFLGSTSKAASQTVGKATTTTVLTSSQNPSKVGQPVTFTAIVTPEFSGTPTGKVAFYDGTKLLKTVTLSGGTAAFTTGLTKGAHSITANYDGSTSFIASSASLTQTVN